MNQQQHPSTDTGVVHSKPATRKSEEPALKDKAYNVKNLIVVGNKDQEHTTDKRNALSPNTIYQNQDISYKHDPALDRQYGGAISGQSLMNQQGYTPSVADGQPEHPTSVDKVANGMEFAENKQRGEESSALAMTNEPCQQDQAGIMSGQNTYVRLC